MRYVLLTVCCYANGLFAQTGLSSISMYTTQNGLSNNSIYCIRQDTRGFLWLGTQEGLSRFDGYRFKKIFADKDPTAGLASNTIMDILEYQNGQLLIATSNGLSVFNTLSNDFENEKIFFPDLKAGSGRLISSLYKNIDGKIWVNHSGELDILDSNLRYLYRFTELPWAKELKGIKIQWENWFTDKQSRIWLPSDTSGIQIIDLSRKKIWNSRNNPLHYEFLNPKYIRAFYLDETANLLWYAPWGEGIYRYDLTSHTQQQQNFGSAVKNEIQSVNAILKINPGKILCAKGLECFILDVSSLKYDPVPVDITRVTVTLFKSINNNFWVGTQNGLFQLVNEQAIAKKLILSQPGAKKSPGECIGIVHSSSGKLYVGCSNNALLEVDKDLSGFERYAVPGKKNVNLTCLQKDELYRLWIGTSKGLYHFNEFNKTFTQPKWFHPDLYNSLINFIYCDREKNIWIATRKPFGLYHYMSVTGKCEKIKNSVIENFASVGESSRISYITEDDKQLWMVSRLGGGIIGYNKKTNEWRIYPRQKKNLSQLFNPLGHVYADNGANLWLHDVFGSGLIRYNYENDSISLVTRNDGLPSDFIKSISYDGSGNLWILTEYGISRFDLQSHKITFNTFFKSKPLYPEAYLSFDSLSQNIICVDNNQLLFYPVSAFQAEKKENLVPLIDKIWVNSKEIVADVNGQSLELKPGQTNVSIDFTAVHYSNADKIKFAYQLSGADHDWKYADVSRSAQYAVLTPGKYIFKIKVADENGNWGEDVDSFSFTIVPHFWQTGWFKVSVGLLLVAVCWLLVRRRIKGIRYDAEMKRQIAETEMMALRAQMNPHFIFNCINSIDAMIQSNDKYQATVYLNKFARLIRNILDSSKQNLVPLSKDIETLQLYVDLELFRNENKFTATIQADPVLLQEDYQVPPLIVQPYVENAILHGLRHRQDNEGRLNVSIQRDNGTLKYEITDNGVGRNEKHDHMPNTKKQKQAYGMQISNDRVRIFNNEAKASVQITDLENNGKSCGTKVTVQLKIQ